MCEITSFFKTKTGVGGGEVRKPMNTFGAPFFFREF